MTSRGEQGDSWGSQRRGKEDQSRNSRLENKGKINLTQKEEPKRREACLEGARMEFKVAMTD